MTETSELAPWRSSIGLTSTVMTHDVAGGSGSAGRHRSPWGKPGRILPVRWGRVIAAVAAFALIVVSLALILGRLAGDGRAAGPTNRSGGPTAPFAPAAQGPSDVLTATTTTHRPGAAASSTPAAGIATSTAPASVLASPSAVPSGVRSRAAGQSGAAAVPVAPRPTCSVLAVSATTVDLGRSTRSGGLTCVARAQRRSTSRSGRVHPGSPSSPTGPASTQGRTFPW